MTYHATDPLQFTVLDFFGAVLTAGAKGQAGARTQVHRELRLRLAPLRMHCNMVQSKLTSLAARLVHGS